MGAIRRLALSVQAGDADKDEGPGIAPEPLVLHLSFDQVGKELMIEGIIGK